jgi:hypothetical protein
MPGPVTGQRGAFPQPNKWGRNDQGNWSQVSFEGTKPEVFLLASAYANTPGVGYEVTEQFGKWRLDVHLPYSVNGIDPKTDFTEIWEFFSMNSEIDILEARVENPNSIGSLDQLQIEKIRAALTNLPSIDELQDPASLSKVTPDKLTNADGKNGDMAYQIYSEMLSGTRNFPVMVPLLRHTISTSSQYAIAASLVNVRRIISSATLISMESIPQGLLFNLPFELSNSPDLLNYGWLKFFPTIQETAHYKWQIVQEYHYGLWSKLFWGLPL